MQSQSGDSGIFPERPAEAPAPFEDGLNLGFTPDQYQPIEGWFDHPADADAFSFLEADTTGLLRVFPDFPEYYGTQFGDRSTMCAYSDIWSHLECTTRAGRPLVNIPVSPGSSLTLATARGSFDDRDEDERVIIRDNPLRLVSQSTTFQFGPDDFRSGEYTIRQTGHFRGFPKLVEVPAYPQAFEFGDGDRYCISDATTVSGTFDQVDAYSVYLNLDSDPDVENRQVLMRLPLTDATGNRLDLETFGLQIRGNISGVVYVFNETTGEVLYGDGLDEQDPSFDEFETEFGTYQGDQNPIVPMGFLAEHDLSGESHVVVMFGAVIRNNDTALGCAFSGRGTWPIKQGQVNLMPIYAVPPDDVTLGPPSQYADNGSGDLQVPITVHGYFNQVNDILITASANDQTYVDSVNIGWRRHATGDTTITATLSGLPDQTEFEVTLQPRGRGMYYERVSIGEPFQASLVTPNDPSNDPVAPATITLEEGDIRHTDITLELPLEVTAPYQRLDHLVVTGTTPSGYQDQVVIQLDGRRSQGDTTIVAELDSAPDGETLELVVQPRLLESDGTPANLGEAYHFTLTVPVDGEAGPETSAFTLSDPYPNPSSTTANFTLTTNSPGPITFRVMDVQGRVVINGEVQVTRSRDVQLDVSSLAAGIYILQASTDTEVATRRLTVAR